jgi:nucleoside-diphosphate-sugar epimerase
MIVLTGASGWFGKTFIYEYINAHGFRKCLDEIVPFTRDGKDINVLDYVIPSKKFSDLLSFSEADVLVHSAFITRDKISTMGDSLYKSENTKITQAVCTLIENSAFKKIFVTSSGVAGLPKEERIKDLYAELKFQEECLISERQSKGLFIYRIFGATGKFIPECEWSAISNFISQCKSQKKITIRAKGKVLRSYVSFHELSRLIISQISSPIVNTQATIINAASVNTDIHQIASIVAEISGVDASNLSSVENYIEHEYICDVEEFKCLCRSNNITLGDKYGLVRECMTYLYY